MSNDKEKVNQEETQGQETNPQETNPNIYTLKKPIDRMGEKITELNLDFDKLELTDMLEADKDLSDMIGPQAAASVPVKAFNTAYQIAIAARAAGIPVIFLQKMSVKDATSVGLRVQDFLLSGE